MQVFIILILWFSDSLVFGARSEYGYPLAVPLVWTAFIAIIMLIPWLRLPCEDESNVSDSETMHGI